MGNLPPPAPLNVRCAPNSDHFILTSRNVAKGGNPSLLTARQVEVLALISEGNPNKTIATKLTLSEKTVKAHITAIFKALNVVNRTQAAAAAREAGII